jgi:hypothetical protein
MGVHLPEKFVHAAQIFRDSSTRITGIFEFYEFFAVKLAIPMPD